MNFEFIVFDLILNLFKDYIFLFFGDQKYIVKIEYVINIFFNNGYKNN